MFFKKKLLKGILLFKKLKNSERNQFTFYTMPKCLLHLFFFRIFEVAVLHGKSCYNRLAQDDKMYDVIP